MLKIDSNYEVAGWEHAIRGMRNPKDSWDRSDSLECPGYCIDCVSSFGEYPDACPVFHSTDNDYVLGPNDRKLAEALRDGGPVHAKEECIQQMKTTNQFSLVVSTLVQ